MRFSGRLQTWNEERGFGFIRPLDGGQDIFVHVSSLPRPMPPPEEILTFAVALNRDGKKKAVDVRLQRVEQHGLVEDRRRASGRPAPRERPYERRDRSRWPAVLAVLLVGIVATGYGYKRVPWRAMTSDAIAAPPMSEPERNVGTDSWFRCDGRTLCSQMTSCAEATYFLKSCPGTQMDGNHDGVPCERQWCQ